MHDEFGKNISWNEFVSMDVPYIYSCRSCVLFLSVLCSWSAGEGKIMHMSFDFYSMYAKYSRFFYPLCKTYVYQWLSSFHPFYSFYYATTSSVHVYLLFE